MNSSPHGHPVPTPSYSGRGHHSSRQQHFNLSPHTPSPKHTTSAVEPGTARRRLHIRSVTFRTPQLPTNRLSTKLSRIFHGNEEPQPELGRQEHQEDQAQKHDSVRATRSARSTLGIINELTNSTRRRLPEKPPVVPVFEDSPERPLLEASPRTPATVYHDAVGIRLSPLSPLSSAYPRNSPRKMRLREVSGNERRSPSGYSSPLSSSAKGKQSRRSDRRTASFETAEYVEHIERQLAEVKAQTHSPSTGKPVLVRLNAVKSENKRLVKAVQELEETFEERVKQAVEHLTSIEAELRRRINTLEDELDHKQMVIQELQYQHDEMRMDQVVAESLKAAIEKLEQEKQSLEDSNRSMGRRNEVLTELLAMSPTKAQQGVDLASPTRDVTRRTPRPRSMLLTRMPTSPSLTHSVRPKSLFSSSSFSTGYFSPLVTVAKDAPHPCSSMQHRPGPKSTADTQSIDSGLGESCSVHSATQGSSRRSTLGSQRSVSPSSWGLPLPVSPGEEKSTVRQTGKRKPRRFMSGSTQLKPLLLPTMTAEYAQSPSLIPLPLSPGRRDVSENSIDPTTSFLSQPLESLLEQETCQLSWLTEEPETWYQSSVDNGEASLIGPADPQNDVPCNIAAATSSHYAVTTAFEKPSDLNTLSLLDLVTQEELTSFLIQETPSGSDQPKSSSAGATPMIENSPPLTEVDVKQALQTLDLEMPALEVSRFDASPHVYTPLSQDVLESIEVRSPHIPVEGTHFPLPEYNEREGSDLFQSLLQSVKTTPALNPKKRRLATATSNLSESDEADSESSPLLFRHRPIYKERRILTPTSVFSSQRPPGMSPSDPRLESQSPERPPCKASSRSCSPLEILQRRTVDPRPIASVTIQTIYGTLSRYTTYIREIKRDPTALARRVIANAWCKNWKRLGRLSWWVLGLFLGHGVRSDSFGREGWDWDYYDGEGIAERVVVDEEAGLLGTQIGADYGSPNANETSSSTVRLEEGHGGYRTRGSRSPVRPVLKGAKPQKDGWGKSLYLWGKFSLAIMIAVGGAVVKGPGEMMKDCDQNPTGMSASSTSHRRQPSRSHVHRSPPKVSPRQSRKDIDGQEDLNCIIFTPTIRPFDFSMDYEPDRPGPSTEGEATTYKASPSYQDRRRRASSDVTFERSYTAQLARGMAGSWPSPDRYDRKRPPSEKPSTFTFGSPCQDDGWDRFDDNGAARPSLARVPPDVPHASEHARTLPTFGRTTSKPGQFNIGTLEWMQSLSLEDLRDIREEPGGSSGIVHGNRSWLADGHVVQ